MNFEVLIRRCLAAMFDGFVVFLPLMFLSLGLFRLSTSQDLVIALATGYTLYGFYEVFGVTLYGRTLGHHLLKLRIVSDAELGDPPVLRALVRWCVKTLTPLFWVAAFVPPAARFMGDLYVLAMPVIFGSMVLGRRHRGLHDKAAGTVVGLVRQENQVGPAGNN